MILTVVTLPLAVAREAWAAVWRFLDGHYPIVDLPHELIWLEGFAPFTWMGRAFAAPPTYDALISLSIGLLIPLAVGLASLQLFVPMRHRIRVATGCQPMLLRNSHAGYQQFIDEHAPRGKRKRISLYSIPLDGIVAFALSAPFNRHAIVISDGLMRIAPTHVLEWVLAHELAHIRYRDTVSGSFWLLTMRSTHLFARLRVWLIVAMMRLLSFLPVLRLLTWPLALLIRLVILTGRIGSWLGRQVFLLFDRWASRQMEFHADRYAAQMLGSEAGIQLFQALQHGALEPTFNLFASHPSHERRIKALRALSTGNATPASVEL